MQKGAQVPFRSLCDHFRTGTVCSHDEAALLYALYMRCSYQ
jgi:hypothetical protein